MTNGFDLSIPEGFEGAVNRAAGVAGLLDAMNDETTDTKELVLTSAEDWANESKEGSLYELPGSGKVARLRKPSLLAMSIKAGYVPNPLSNEVLRFMAEVDQDRRAYGSEEPSPAKKLEHYKNRVAAFMQICQLAFVSPELVLDGTGKKENGQINATDLSDRDVMWIVFALVEGEALPIKPPFRKPGGTEEA